MSKAISTKSRDVTKRGERARAVTKPVSKSAEPQLLPNKVSLALGANIRRYRIAAGMTQEELSQTAEIERSRISKMETGVLNPATMTLACICWALKITLPDLFKGVTATLPSVAEGGIARRTNQAVLEKSSKPRKPKIKKA